MDQQLDHMKLRQEYMTKDQKIITSHQLGQLEERRNLKEQLKKQRLDELKVKAFREMTRKFDINPINKGFKNKLESNADKLFEKAEESTKKE